MSENQSPILNPLPSEQLVMAPEQTHQTESHQRMRAGECPICGIVFSYPFAVFLQHSENKLPLFCPYGHRFVPVKTEIIGVEADRIQLLVELPDARHRINAGGGPEMNGLQSDLSILSLTAPLALDVRRPSRGVAGARRLRIFQRSKNANVGDGRSGFARGGPRGSAGGFMDFSRECAALVLVNARRRLCFPRDGSMVSRFTRPRRRRGGRWTLYEVEQESGPIGFAVFADEKRPHLKAFVPGAGGQSRQLAVKIDRGGAITKPAVDLREVPWSKLPAEIAGTRRLELSIDEDWSRPVAFISGSVLIPIDRRGRKAVSRADAAIKVAKAPPVILQRGRSEMIGQGLRRGIDVASAAPATRAAQRSRNIIHPSNSTTPYHCPSM